MIRVWWADIRWPVGLYPHSRLCIRCRNQHVIVPADDASTDSCRGHLVEDRVNELIRTGRVDV